MKYISSTILTLEYNELVPAILSESNYKYHKKEGNIVVHGLGGNGRQVFIEFETLPEKFKTAVKAEYGDPYAYIIKQPLLNSIEWDTVAQAYYNSYVLPNGDKLPNTPQDLRGKTQINYVHRYTQNASWLNMLSRLTQDKRALKRELNVTMADFWALATDMINLKKVALPTNSRRLKDKLKAYTEGGYESLIETHKFGNNHSAKVDNEVGEALLKELIAHHNNHDDTIIAQAYNSWATENNHPTIKPGTVGYRRKQWRNELMLERQGVGIVANSLSKNISRERASCALLFINGDDNILDAFFTNGESKWYRPALYVIIDTFNDYILGYSWGDNINTELLKDAFRNANNHVKAITGDNYTWHQLQTDRWGISGKNTTKLEEFYNSISNFVPAGLKNASSKYIERSFGTTWHQVLKMVFPHSYAGNNVGSKSKINRDLLNPNNFPDISEADEQIAFFIQAMRNTKRKGCELTREQEWLQSFNNAPSDKIKLLTEQQRLEQFGVRHTYTNKITASGIVPTLKAANGQSFTVQYELSQAEILQHVGKAVQVIYDKHDLSRILITDGKGLRQVVNAFQKVPAAFADYQPGDAERIKALQAEKKTLLPMLQQSIAQRKQVLERARIDAESRLQAGVIVKEINHDDQRLFTSNTQETSPLLTIKSAESEGVRAEKSTKEPIKKPFKPFKNTAETYYDEY